MEMSQQKQRTNNEKIERPDKLRQNNYPPDFWKWAAELTKDYKFTEAQYEAWYITNTKPNYYQTIYCWNILSEYHSQNLENLIYQTIDGYNGKYKGVHNLDNKSDCVCWWDEDHYADQARYWFYANWPSPTAARFAALAWIWEQGVKAEIATKHSHGMMDKHFNDLANGETGEE
jgi:hypothetical protein